ncbi:MAG: DUF1573 domain-containing protein [Candidatus Omnitrophota bacterium]
MRRILSLLFLGLMIFQIVSAQDVTVDPNEWDFGQIKQDQILKHDFTFKNNTNTVLNILTVNTSCGCTASQADKKLLNPGDSATINVSFNSHGYAGPVKQFIYVNTDNADLPIVKFSIKCEVIK